MPRARPPPRGLANAKSDCLRLWRFISKDRLMTPMMQQYREAKDRHPGMLLLFRMGDFFELFDDDAAVAARVLGLTLTSRDKTIPMAGFPHHQRENCLHASCCGVEFIASPSATKSRDPAQAKGLVPPRGDPRRHPWHRITEDDLLDPPPKQSIWPPYGRDLRMAMRASPAWNYPPASFTPPTSRRRAWRTSWPAWRPRNVCARKKTLS